MNRERIPAKKVYIKTHSSGFLLNVPGIPLHHDQVLHVWYQD